MLKVDSRGYEKYMILDFSVEKLDQLKDSSRKIGK
jgi:hypothetical protein